MFVELPKQRQQLEALRHLAIAEVAELVGCTPQHIRNLIARGEFPPGKKLGSLRRWSISELEQYLSSKETK